MWDRIRSDHADSMALDDTDEARSTLSEALAGPIETAWHPTEGALNQRVRGSSPWRRTLLTLAFLSMREGPESFCRGLQVRRP
jgi:hypothetical protein